MIIISTVFYAVIGYQYATDCCYRKYVENDYYEYFNVMTRTRRKIYKSPELIEVDYEEYNANLPKYRIIGAIIGGIVGFFSHALIDILTNH